MIETIGSADLPAAEASPDERRAVRRLLPRFGLRSLLIFGLAFCLLFGLLGRNYVRIRREDAAIETLKQTGATIYVAEDDGWAYHPATSFFPEDPDWKSGSSFVSRLIGWSGDASVLRIELRTDHADAERLSAGLATLAQVPEVEDIGLAGPQIGDDSLKSLSVLPHLKTLALVRTSVTKQGLAGLSSPERLQVLSLVHDRSATDVLAGVSGLAELRFLQAIHRSVSRAEMTEIASLPKLETLRVIVVTSAEPDAFAALKDAKSLRDLSVHVPGLDDAVARQIADVTRLERLSVQGIGDEGLAKLASLSALSRLELAPPVTQEAARAFAADHPDCVVTHSTLDGTIHFYRGTQELDSAVAEVLFEAQDARRDEGVGP